MEKVTYTNSRGQSIELDNSGPFFLSDFDTGTPKTTMLTSKAPGQDGVTYEDTVLDERSPSANGVIKGTSYEDTLKKRKQLCSIFNPKLMGVLIYENDIGIYKINCTAQEIPTFKNTDSIAQEFLIQFYCPSPFWEELQETKKEIALWMGDFEFPLEIIDGDIQMGHRVSNLIVNANNVGDIPCGMRIEFIALASVVNPSILNVYTQEIIKVKRTLDAGDKLIVNTEYGNKTVRLIKNGVESNALNYINPIESTFIQLNVGDNLLRYDADSGIDNLQVAVYFTPKYVGV